MEGSKLYLVTYETETGETQIEIECKNLREAESTADLLLLERMDLIRVRGIREYHHDKKDNMSIRRKKGDAFDLR
jgi:hypothetical protein